MIQVQDLICRLGGRDVLRDVTVSARAGECIGVIGPNGAGKTTFLRSLAGLIPSQEGSITLSGLPLLLRSPTERAQQIGYLPQQGECAWPLILFDMVALARLPHRPLAGFGPLSERDHAAITAALKMTATRHLAERLIDELSGGERARGFLARVLAGEPQLLLADEPLESFDPAYRIAMAQLLKTYAEAGHVVFATLHDLTLAARYCHRLLLFGNGRLIADGTPQDVLTAEITHQAFGLSGQLIWLNSGPVMEWEADRAIGFTGKENAKPE